MRGSPNDIRLTPHDAGVIGDPVGNGHRRTRGVAASTKLAAGTKGHTANHRRAQNSQRGRKYHFSHSAPLLGVFMRYSRSIRWVYVCIGYVSGICRKSIGK